jgi:hypothetical protein
MESLSIAHPLWIALGLVMLLIGVWLIRWAARNNMASAISSATAEAAFNTIRKGGKFEVPGEVRARMDDVRSAQGTTGKAKKVAGYAFRHAMSQLFGIVGFLLVTAGLVAIILGVYYSA